MALICPTITAETPSEFSAQLAKIQPFSVRIHIDVADGKFAPRRLLDPAQVYLPEHIPTDIHVMYDDPASQLMTLISLRPQLVVLHTEAKGDIAALLQELQKVDITAGIALLPGTKVHDVAELVRVAQHVLIFGGHLGFQGGQADMSQLQKVEEIKTLNPHAEIAWDGGVNLDNVAALAQSGIDVINVGSAIQKAIQPQAAFSQLQQLANA